MSVVGGGGVLWVGRGGVGWWCSGWDDERGTKEGGLGCGWCV